jgi:hypothetical protein
MRNFLAIPFTIPFLATAILAAPTPTPAKIRTIANTPNFASEALRQLISPAFYKRLSMSPIDGWIIVRARVADNRLIAAQVAQSDLNGAYDSLALKLANEFEIQGIPTTGTHIPDRKALLHLLIYKLADGKMALSFVHLDDAGGNQGYYYGSPWLAVQKNGKWKQILPKPEAKDANRVW